MTVAVDDADGRRNAGQHGGAFHRRDRRERAADGEPDQHHDHVAGRHRHGDAHRKWPTSLVTDDALGTNVLSLSGADAALFEIDGSVLYLKAGAVLDYGRTRNWTSRWPWTTQRSARRRTARRRFPSPWRT